MNCEESFVQKTKELQECQSNKGLDSCMKCEKFLECSLRKEFVFSAYQSMNEDIQNGGFNFN